MHGIVKVRTTAEQEALKKKERAEKLKHYRAGIAIAFKNRKNGIYDDELMTVTERMLLQNPDIYTLWNIRREAFQNNNWEQNVLEEKYKQELIVTENCLRQNPKSYCVWHQRCWVMDHMPNPDWIHELALCTKCLNIDERNFHCWDYREFVVQRSRISSQEEFDFSTSKILNNFSNYSSWHYRSRLLSKMFLDLDERATDEKRQEELDLVLNATFTDPSDSSAWFYQRWLLDTSKRTTALCRAMFTGNFLIISFNGNVPKDSTMSLLINERKVDTVWTFDELRLTKLLFGQVQSVENLSNVDKVQLEYFETQDSTPILYNLKPSKSSHWIYKTQKELVKNYNDNQLREQLSSYKQLMEMEPNNKWCLLTGVLLMRKIDPVDFHQDILGLLEKLKRIDSLRQNYYDDLRSAFVVEHRLDELWRNESENDIERNVDLSGLGLTTLRHEEQFAFFEEINLGVNNLSHCLDRLAALKSCKKLSLSSNGLKSLQNFPVLENLRVLSLRNNQIKESSEVIKLMRRHKLEKLDIRDNPIDDYQSLVDSLNPNSPELELLTE